MKPTDSTLKSLDILLTEDSNSNVVIKSGYNRLSKMLLLILGFLPFIIILYSLFVFVNSNGADIGVLFFSILGVLGLLLYTNFVFSVLLNSIEISKNKVVLKIYDKFKFSTQINKIEDISEFKTNYNDEMKTYLKLSIISKEIIEVPIFSSRPPYFKEQVEEIEHYLNTFLGEGNIPKEDIEDK
jgi:hypothetical protein